MECSPESFLGAVLTAAQLKLEFGPMQQAYLVPYGREIQLIIGYKGWLTLMNRSAEIQSVSARTVYERDTFEIEYGLDENLIHKPASGDRGKPVAYYAVIRKTNGGRSFAVMTHAEVIKHRDRYGKKGGKLIGPWADPDQFEAMAFKTVFLKAKTWVPTSVETQVAQDMDTRVVKRMTVDQEPEIVPDDDVVDAEIVDTETGEVKSQADLEDEEWIAQARGDDA
jgi:recombination protein RecT